MKKSFGAVIGFVWITSLFSLPVSAAENNPGNPRSTVLKSLALDRLMLSRFEAEYAALSKEDAGSASESSKRKLVDVRYKIQALDEENKKLAQNLPETMQANEFLKDMLARSD